LSDIDSKRILIYVREGKRLKDHVLGERVLDARPQGPYLFLGALTSSSAHDYRRPARSEEARRRSWFH
jgi:hypothetical protein